MCIDAKQDGKISIAVDGGKWYAKKVQNILGENTNQTDSAIPILPVTGWKEFPSCTIPESFCYGSIYQHIIASAKLYDPKTVQSNIVY